MQEDELEALDRDLAAVSERMASALPADDLARGVRRRLARPLWSLAGALTLVGGLVLASLWAGEHAGYRSRLLEFIDRMGEVPT